MVYCVFGPLGALGPRVGPLLMYKSVFLALCQQPVPSRAFPSLLSLTQDVHPVRSPQCLCDGPKHTISLTLLQSSGGR